MLRRQVLINAVMSMAQIVVISVILFILYRFLLITIGIEKVGIWSLVIATASVTQIANFGLSGSVVKYIAKYVAQEDNEKVSAVIQTSLLFIVFTAGLVLVIIYPFSKWLLRLVVPEDSLILAFTVLPYSFISLWLLMISGILQAGLDGYQRIDTRSILLIGGAAINLLLCFMMAPQYGLMGVAYANVIQNITVLLAGWIMLKRYLKFLPVLPYKWDKGIFNEIIRYGLNFQIISVTNMLNDPVTKALLSKFGGLHMVGFYEMASKMIQQFRSVIVSANQVLVPAIADLHENNPDRIKDVYGISYQLLFYLSLPVYSLLIVCAPMISELWLGSYEGVFVIAVTLLAIGWCLNTLSAPAYFANLGTGELFWNVAAHITIGLLNAVFGFFLGLFYNGMGVIMAWVFALATGSFIIYLSYHLKNNIPMSDMIPKTSRLIVTTCLLSIALTSVISQKISLFNPFTVNISVTFLFTIIIIVLLWIHPMRKRVIEWINSDLLRRKTREQEINC